MTNFKQLYNSIRHLSHSGVFSYALENNLRSHQTNILMLLKSRNEEPSDENINQIVENLVHVVLGNFIGSEYGDVIECREDLPTKEETIQHLQSILSELRPNV